MSYDARMYVDTSEKKIFIIIITLYVKTIILNGVH